MPRCNNKEPKAGNQVMFEESSGNVFVDLGNSEAKAINIVARLQLMMQIEDIVKERGLTQEQAAKILGLRQPRVSELMSSRSEKFTVDMLMKLLDRLGKQVVLTVEDKSEVA
jgi:predicted XRE-type DNA-binding protein